MQIYIAIRCGPFFLEINPLHMVTYLLRFYKLQITLILFCITLVIIRITVTKSFFLSFLIWNLVLAIIPYALSQFVYFYGTKRLHKLVQYVFFCLWLVFLPNSPYLITDLIHLHSSYAYWRWFDLYLLFIFAFSGWLFGTLSMIDIYSILKKNLGILKSLLIVFLVCFSTSYGMYLGRFSRLNSWDIFFKTSKVFTVIKESITIPYVWAMTLAFGLFLALSVLIIKGLKENKL